MRLNELDASTLAVQVQPSVSAGCWPLTDVLYSQVPKDYPTSYRDMGLLGLTLLAWSVNSTAMLRWSDANMLVQVGSIEALQVPIMAALNSVTSDGSTLLVTLPVVWQLTASIHQLGIALSVIGIVCMAGAALFIARNAQHSVYRSSSPVFVYISLLGVLALFVDMQLLTVSSPSDAECSALNWVTQLGYTLLFGPLFLKAYRIYRIFGKRRLKVVKLSNARLLSWLAALLVCDVVYLGVWQSVAPVVAVTTLQLETDQRMHSYVQCSFGYSSASYDFFIASAVLKAAWLLVGVLLAFSTKSASGTFNESKAIAMAIYNAVFAIGVIAPLIKLIDAIGDTLVILLLFGLVWIAFFTLAILTVPKLMAFRSATKVEAGSSGEGQSVESDSAFSFILLTELTAPATVASYIAALEKHTGEAKTYLAGMKGKGVKINSAQGYNLASPVSGMGKSFGSFGSQGRGASSSPREARTPKGGAKVLPAETIPVSDKTHSADT